MLRVSFTPQFQRDSKRLKKKHVDLAPLKNLVDLVAQNTPEALEELRHGHNMHDLKVSGQAAANAMSPTQAISSSSGEKATGWPSFRERTRTMSCSGSGETNPRAHVSPYPTCTMPDR
jgi:hypothetical protein